MKASNIFHCVAIVAALGAPWAHAAESDKGAPPASVPVEAFASFADMDDPILSPDGTAIAMLVRNTAGRRQLAVIDTADLTKARVVASFEEFDIWRAHWVNDKRLVFGLYDESQPASASESRALGLYAVDRNGENFRALILQQGNEMETGTMIKHRVLSPREYRFERTLADGSDDVVIDHDMLSEQITNTGTYVITRGELTGVLPVRLDTRTGALHEMTKGRVPDNAWTWAIDDQGHVAATMVEVRGEDALMVPEADGSWKERARFPAYGRESGYSLVERMGPDGTVYARAVTEGGAYGLYRLDLATGKTGTAPIVSVKGFDVGAALVEDRHARKLLGVRYQADAGGTAWFDPAMKAMQAKVDAKLPGLVNTVVPAACGCAPRALVISSSDRQPPIYFLYEIATDTLVSIGSSRPAITARQMADTDFVRIKARDGSDLPLYVTKPHGKGPWPTVVLVHGGPWLRGWHWDWDADSQFLASRGYLVVKPEFRGSRGYGPDLLFGGVKQWGLAMQDDIADATRWAAKQGLADPARTCIAGASYGGYATLMGLVRYPDLYRCGIAWAAVSDINLMYDIHWSDFGSDWRAYGMPTLIGDQQKDAAQLEATSPLKQAAKITRPLLLAHGGVDHRVPIDHASKMLSALEAAHAPVTWVVYKDEGHGWYQPANRADFYRRMEAFLAANIGAGSASTKSAATAEQAPPSH